MYPRLFQFGHFAIPTYGAFSALALVAALAALMHFARRLNLDANKIWTLGLIGILTTLVVARLLLVTAYFSAFRRHPFWILGLTANRSTWIDTVALCLGFAAAILYALAEGLPILRMLDCIAPAAALVLNRTGAFLSGVDYGLPAAHGWSIVYTSRIAAFWYRTPLGVRLYPVQLYQAIASLVILGILAGWLPRRTQDGELWGAWLFLSGGSSFFLNFYSASAQSQWIIPQPVAVAMVIASPAFLLLRKSGGYTVEDGSPRI